MSNTEARCSLPSPVGTSVPSPNHFWLGRLALNWRPTRSGARHRPPSGRVVALRFLRARASVSNLAGELIEDGIVEEAGQVESDGGRPRVLLRVAPEYGYVVGVDVGETRVQVELFDTAMTALAKSDYSLDSAAPKPADVVSRVLDGLHAVVAQAGVDPARVIGVGVAVSGVVERPADAVVYAQTLGWDAVPLGAILRAGTDLPVLVDN